MIPHSRPGRVAQQLDKRHTFIVSGRGPYIQFGNGLHWHVNQFAVPKFSLSRKFALKYNHSRPRAEAKQTNNNNNNNKNEESERQTNCKSCVTSVRRYTKIRENTRIFSTTASILRRGNSISNEHDLTLPLDWSFFFFIKTPGTSDTHPLVNFMGKTMTLTLHLRPFMLPLHYVSYHYFNTLPWMRPCFLLVYRKMPRLSIYDARLTSTIITIQIYVKNFPSC